VTGALVMVGAIAVILAGYIVATEAAKAWFYRSVGRRKPVVVA